MVIGRRRNNGGFAPSASRQSSHRRTVHLSALAAVVALVMTLSTGFPQAWVLQQRRSLSSGLRPSSQNRLGCCIRLGALATKRSEAFIKCVEEYDPANAEEFKEGSPCSGFRNMTEALRPHHPNPQWMIFPEGPSFARDQKMATLYTLANPMYGIVNKGMREDNEDSMRRHAPFIHALREVLRFETKKIHTPEGRKCQPYIGDTMRAINVPEEDVAKVVAEYKDGTEFTWPSFVSTQNDETGLWPYTGNIHFEIICNIDPKKMGVDEVYAPVKMSRFIQESTEILFPPHTKFKVVGEREVQSVKGAEKSYDVYTKILEVTELPTPWHIQKNRKR